MDAGTLSGTGPQGAVSLADVEAAAKSAAPSTARPPCARPSPRR
ncbi:hypothetical protein ACFSHR_19365 [Azotobacter chroococcum]